MSWCDLDLASDFAVVTLTCKPCPCHISDRSYLEGTLFGGVGVKCYVHDLTSEINLVALTLIMSGPSLKL